MRISHGWHDWYLAANLNSESSLDGHLLPGLDPKGCQNTYKEPHCHLSIMILMDLKKL